MTCVKECGDAKTHRSHFYKEESNEKVCVGKSCADAGLLEVEHSLVC